MSPLKVDEAAFLLAAFTKSCAASAGELETLRSEERAVSSNKKSKQDTSKSKSKHDTQLIDDSIDPQKVDAEMLHHEAAMQSLRLPQPSASSSSVACPDAVDAAVTANVSEATGAKGASDSVADAVETDPRRPVWIHWFSQIQQSLLALEASQNNSKASLGGDTAPYELSLMLDVDSGKISLVVWQDPIRLTGRFARLDPNNKVISVLPWEPIVNFSDWQIVLSQVGVSAHRSRRADRPELPSIPTRLMKMWELALASFHSEESQAIDMCFVCSKRADSRDDTGDEAKAKCQVCPVCLCSFHATCSSELASLVIPEEAAQEEELLHKFQNLGIHNVFLNLPKSDAVCALCANVFCRLFNS